MSDGMAYFNGVDGFDQARLAARDAAVREERQQAARRNVAAWAWDMSDGDWDRARRLWCEVADALGIGGGR
jgi:hypothetical protein